MKKSELKNYIKENIKSTLSLNNSPIKEASEPYQLNVVFKDPEDYIRAKQWFSEESDFYASSEHDEFQTISFEVADQDDADATERAIDQELLNHGEIESWYFEIEGAVTEIDINDPVLVTLRAAKDRRRQYQKEKDVEKLRHTHLRNVEQKIQALERARQQVLSDMEQEAEREGGPIADLYGDKLNKIDQAIARLTGQGKKKGIEFTYDDAKKRAAMVQELLNHGEIESCYFEIEGDSLYEGNGSKNPSVNNPKIEKITSKSQLQEGPEEINNAYYDILAKIAKYAKQLNDDDAYQLHQQLKSFFNRLLEDKSPIKEAGRSYRVSKDAIEVNQLKPGDILRGSGAEIIAISSGLNTPSGKMDVTIKYPNGREETKQWGKYTKVVADSKDKVTTEVTIVDKNTKPEEISSLKRSKDPKTVDLAVSQAKKTSTPVSIAEEDDVEKEDDWYKSKDEDGNKDKEPSKSELKKDAKATKGVAKAKDELAILTREMKSLAKKYKEAKGAEKDKIVADLKAKTKLKRELESILNK
jgi:hypothetical protein